MIFQGSKRVPVHEVILHCAAVPTAFFDGQRAVQVFSTINRWHKERGFAGFGYHALVMPDGACFPGRPYDKIGAHVIGHNTGTIGVLLIESRQIDRIGDFDDWFTDHQWIATRSLIRAIPGISKVSGHNDYAPKLCPGFKVRSNDWL
jgi:N-acetylmuramoyl-L-alanine amidase